MATHGFAISVLLVTHKGRTCLFDGFSVVGHIGASNTTSGPRRGRPAIPKGLRHKRAHGLRRRKKKELFADSLRQSADCCGRAGTALCNARSEMFGDGRGEETLWSPCQDLRAPRSSADRCPSMACKMCWGLTRDKGVFVSLCVFSEMHHCKTE